jgi:hypothetical protein
MEGIAWRQMSFACRPICRRSETIRAGIKGWKLPDCDDTFDMSRFTGDGF